MWSLISGASHPHPSIYPAASSAYTSAPSSQSPPTSTPTNLSTRQRATDRQRQHRARQRARLQELEESLAKKQTQQLDLARRIQSEARLVARENVRLRELLEGLGVPKPDVDGWVLGGMPSAPGPVKGDNCRLRAIKGGLISAWSGPREEDVFSRACVSPADTIVASARGSSSDTCSSPLEMNIDLPSQLGPELPETRLSISETTQTATAPSTPQDVNASGHDESHPPSAPLRQIPNCLLISHLISNPQVDLRQLPPPPPPAASSSAEEACDSGLIPCEKAYAMMIPYATSDAKLDIIARGLEGGCVRREDGNGGIRACGVGNEVLWKLLDEVCIE
ncbi:hypothetical protein DFH27DRAFT_631223 [Peziza echinospora]|nr:hypothetical protein DFH27DRAFT_631223 [Peziza echinospora]